MYGGEVQRNCCNTFFGCFFLLLM